jgi:carboxylesterase
MRRTDLAKSMIHNPQLVGEAFYWPGGPIGVVLIHGFSATAAEVRPLAEALHQAGYSVAAPLLPGHYTQPEDLNRVSWQDWVTSVEEMYDRLSKDCEQVVVGGESTGGVLALYMAAEYPDIAALLLFAPALRLTYSRSVIIRLHLAAPFIAYVPKDNMDSNELWQGYPVNPLKGAIQLMNLQKKVKPLLAKIHQPTLIVQGQLDQSVHPDVPEMICKNIQSSLCEIHWMQDSGHCVIIDKERQEIYELTLRFLEIALQPSKNQAAVISSV